MDRDRRLSREDFDAVIRRATELAARDSEPSDELTEEELYRIAGEVGLSEGHVRSALIELRTGGTKGTSSPGILDRLFGVARVQAARVVPGTPAQLASRIDEFMVASRLLQPLRRSRRLLQYRPAVDWISRVSRAASATSRRYYVASAKSVEVRFESLRDEEGRTLVEIEVDPGTRGDSVLGASLGGVLVGGGSGLGAGVLAASAVPVTVAVGAGILAGGAIAGGILSYTSRKHRRRVQEVRAEVEGILDTLETGGRLEPPPPSWLKWVERQFHGARKLMDEFGTLDDEEL